MRTINTIANVTTSGLSRNQVRTVTAGVDAVRASLHQLRLYAAPAHQGWDGAIGDQATGYKAGGQKPFAGKPMPAGTGPMSRASDTLRRSRSSRDESSRCRRPRESSCLARS